MELRTKLEIGALALIAVLVWLFNQHEPTVVDQWKVAKIAPELKLVPKELVTIPVEVFKPEALTVLNLDVPKDDKVVDAVEVPSSLRPQEVVTVVEKSGKVDTLLRAKDYPWLAAEQTGEVRADFGYFRGQQVVRFSVQEELVQVKALHLGVVGTVDTAGNTFIGVGVGYKW